VKLVSNDEVSLLTDVTAVSDDTQLQCWTDGKAGTDAEQTTEEMDLQRLREEVRMLRVRCQRSSGTRHGVVVWY